MPSLGSPSAANAGAAWICSDGFGSGEQQKNVSAQAQHVEHIEQAAGAPGQEAGGMQAALRIACPAAGFVADFNTLAFTREKSGVVAHDIDYEIGRASCRERV